MRHQCTGETQLQLTLMLIIQLVTSVQTCPAGVIPVTTSSQTICITSYNTPMTFCDAVKTCHSVGQEMISKQVFDAMKASSSIPGGSGIGWWVGLVDALSERESNRSGWVWIKDGQVTTEADGYFHSSEPNNSNNQDCANVFTSDKLLRDAGCTETHQFFCYDAPPTTDSSNHNFEMSLIVDFVQPDPGCWILKTGISSGPDCTVHCVSFGRDCVGFYWNSARRECIILPYFDATVPLSYANNTERMLWQKFVRIG